MYLAIIGIVAAAVVVAAVSFLALAYRVIKAAHQRPASSAAGHGPGTGPQTGTQRLVMNVVARAFRLMLRLGFRLGPMMMLTVRGRKSGEPRTNPVDLFEANGQHWLVATHESTANWVLNLRAAGEGTLVRGRRRLWFSASELPQEQAGHVLKEVIGPRLAKPLGGFVLRQTIAVPANAPLEEFVAAAAEHPVFALTIRPAEPHRDNIRRVAATPPA